MSVRLFALLLLLISPTTAPAQSSVEIRLIKQIMAQIQPKSFAQNREYCGYIGFDATGKLVSSRVNKGRRDYCDADWPDSLDVVASWHTHAGFDDGAWSEVPSVSDIEADEAEGIDGYVGTPGGRLWYIDTQDMVVSQICSIGCLPTDGAFLKGNEGRIAASYTYRELLRREAE